jgi:hypothetical protein
MGTFEWIITGATIFISLAGTACAIIIPLLILGGVGYLIYKRSQQSTAYRQSAQTWPSTSGVILSSAAQSYYSGRSHSIRPVVIYQYEVNGRGYQSQTIKAGDQFMTVRIAGQAFDTVNRYPVGSTVTVYYNPANPAESALER